MGRQQKSEVRIAVADDEHDMRQYFCKILPRLGHEVVAVCENGRQLVEKCELIRPELVITDLKMPVMDGLEAAARICQKHPIPFIVLSAIAEIPPMAEPVVAGFLTFLQKPVKMEALRQAIADATWRDNSGGTRPIIKD